MRDARGASDETARRENLLKGRKLPTFPKSGGIAKAPNLALPRAGSVGTEYANLCKAGETSNMKKSSIDDIEFAQARPVVNNIKPRCVLVLVSIDISGWRRSVTIVALFKCGEIRNVGSSSRWTGSNSNMEDLLLAT